MKTAFLSTLLVILALSACNNSDQVNNPVDTKNHEEATDSVTSNVDSVSNSFKFEVPESREITYSYIDSSQIHDYSGSWWYFDDDLEPDNVLFVGTGGAHLYFHLRLILSSDSTVRDFPLLLLDMPIVQNIEVLKNEKFYPPPVLTQFVVHDFDSDAKDEIFIGLDNNTYNALSEELKEMGVTSRYILIDFNDDEVVLKNFMP